MMTLLIAVLAVPLILLGAGPAADLWRRRREKRTIYRRVPAPPLIIPAAEETAACITRFREAVRRFEQEELAWERRTMRALTETGAGAIIRRRHLRRTSR